MALKTLDVFYHGKQVGTLAETGDKRVAFQYSADWIRNGFSISPLSLPLSDNVFVPAEKNREIFSGLFGVFADSLPDNWGRLLLDCYLSAQGIFRENVSVIDRLAYVGSSGMGALEYRPSREKDFSIDSKGLDYDKIAEECGKLLSSKESDHLDELYRLGGSSGGTRPKILVSEREKDWIIKFPLSSDPAISGIREYDYSLCAGECGIRMTETRLVKSAVCDGYFKTERFDRRKDEKIMMLSFAAALEVDFRAPSCDYKTFMQLVRALTKDNKEDKEQMFRQMCFNVEMHNLDDHTKKLCICLYRR